MTESFRPMKQGNTGTTGGAVTVDVAGGVEQIRIQARDDKPLPVVVGPCGLTVCRGDDQPMLTLAIRGRQVVIVMEGQSKDEKIVGFALNVPEKPDVKGTA